VPFKIPAFVRRYVFLTLGLLAASALSVVPIQRASAISQGGSIANAPAWAAYVTTVDKTLFLQDAETSCTGTIVAADWVLTAAHCVVVHKNGVPTGTPDPLSKFRVVLGRSNLSKTYQGGQWTVDKVIVYPSYPAAGSFDLALMHLHGALPASALPLPLAPSGFALRNGQEINAYGYGDTAETYTSQQIAKKQWDDYKATPSDVLRVTAAGSYVDEASCNSAAFWCFHYVGKSEILHGDSGGPWVTSTSNPFVVGVTSEVASPVKATSTTVTWQLAGAARVTTESAYDWLLKIAGIYRPEADTIYRDSRTGQSWLAESDGFSHPIPNGTIYSCLQDEDDPVINLPTFTLRELPKSTTGAMCDPDLG
jgi:hypothetical protein